MLRRARPAVPDDSTATQGVSRIANLRQRRPERQIAMHCDDFQAQGLQEIASAGGRNVGWERIGFHRSVTNVPDTLESSREILGELLAHGVKLKRNGHSAPDSL